MRSRLSQFSYAEPYLHVEGCVDRRCRVMSDQDHQIQIMKSIRALDRSRSSLPWRAVCGLLDMPRGIGVVERARDKLHADRSIFIWCDVIWYGMVCGWPDKITDLAFAVSEVLKSCLTRRSGRELSCMYLLFLVSSFIPAPAIQTGSSIWVREFSTGTRVAAY